MLMYAMRASEEHLEVFKDDCLHAIRPKISLAFASN